MSSGRLLFAQRLQPHCLFRDLQSKHGHRTASAHLQFTDWGNGAMLLMEGNLLFWADPDRRFRACDADSGKILIGLKPLLRLFGFEV